MDIQLWKNRVKIAIQYTLETKPYASMVVIGLLSTITGVSMVVTPDFYTLSKSWKTLEKTKVASDIYGLAFFGMGVAMLLCWWLLIREYEQQRKYHIPERPDLPIYQVLSLVWISGGAYWGFIGATLALTTITSPGAWMYIIFGGFQAQWVAWRINKMRLDAGVNNYVRGHQ